MAAFYNRAFLSYGDRTIASNLARGEILEPVTITKTAVRGEYSAGDTVTYVLVLANSGASNLTDLTVTDDLGEYQFGGGSRVPLDYYENSILYLQNGVAQPSPDVTTNPSLVISGIDIPANGETTIVYQAMINSFAPINETGTIKNNVLVSGTGITSDVTDDETITAIVEPILSISKDISPVPVVDNGIVTYTFTISNSGNTEATDADEIIITDTFLPILADIEVSYNGVSWTGDSTKYAYNEATGAFSTVSGVVTVPAAEIEQNSATGEWTVIPGESTLVISGTI